MVSVVSILEFMVKRLRRWRYRTKRILSRLYALAGVPLFIREGTYECSLSGYRIEVIDCGHRGGIYTKVRILSGDQCMDMCFQRLTGSFDGTGYQGGACALPPSAPLSKILPEKKPG